MYEKLRRNESSEENCLVVIHTSVLLRFNYIFNSLSSKNSIHSRLVINCSLLPIFKLCHLKADLILSWRLTLDKTSNKPEIAHIH